MTGDIVVVRERRTKNEFALKTIQKRDMSEKMLNILRREVEILASLDHVRFSPLSSPVSILSLTHMHTHTLFSPQPNVIHCVEIFETPYRISIVLELGDGTDLFDRLQKQPQGRFKPWIASELVRSMLLALAHCHAYDFFFYRLSKNISTNQQTKHRHGVVHRDIKLDNFIFDRRGVLKLIDFGLSKQWIQNGKVHSKMKIKKMNSVVGTLDTIAPEVMSSDIPYVRTRYSRTSLTHSQLKNKSQLHRKVRHVESWLCRFRVALWKVPVQRIKQERHSEADS